MTGSASRAATPASAKPAAPPISASMSVIGEELGEATCERGGNQVPRTRRRAASTLVDPVRIRHSPMTRRRPTAAAPVNGSTPDGLVCVVPSTWVAGWLAAPLPAGVCWLTPDPDPALLGLLSVRSIVLPDCQWSPETLTLASHGAEFNKRATVGEFGG